MRDYGIPLPDASDDMSILRGRIILISVQGSMGGCARDRSTFVPKRWRLVSGDVCFLQALYRKQIKAKAAIEKETGRIVMPRSSFRPAYLFYQIFEGIEAERFGKIFDATRAEVVGFAE